MPETLRATDPNLVAAVNRSRKTLVFWGVLVLVDSIFTGLVLRGAFPLAPFSGIVVGALCFFSTQPVVYAMVAVQLASTMLRAGHPIAVALGGDPLLVLTQASALEAAAITFTRAIFFYTAAQQFLHYRMLYGTARATGPVAGMPAIPEMVPNRTDIGARWALWCGISSVLMTMASFGLVAFGGQSAALGLASGLAVLGLGLGLGVAFSPTDRRRTALIGALMGLAGYVFSVLAGNFLLTA